MDLAAVRTGLAQAALAAGDLDVRSFVPATITTPLVAVGRMVLTFDQTMGGLLEAVVTVHAFASLADSEQGQDDLVTLLAPGGLKAALEADKTLGGACQELHVETADGPGLAEVGGQQYWSASWTVRVWG